MDTWGGGQIQGRRGGAFQNSTDLKGRRDQEMPYEVVTQTAEASRGFSYRGETFIKSP